MNTTAPALQATAPRPATAGGVLCETDAQGVATLRLGAPTEDIVTLTEARIAALEGALADLETATNLRGLLVTGARPGMFAAGADIHAIADITDPQVGEAAAKRGRAAFDRLAALRVPVVAAIEGPCLGGGLELALACDMRVASDASSTRVGLPEVKLGIVPGFGGTQRLPRLIGLPKALDLILRGKLLDAEQALRSGVVDRVAPSERLLEVARRELDALVAAGRKRPRRKPWSAMTKLLSSTVPGRALVRRKTERSLEETGARFYPAPRHALALCLDALARPASEGFAHEARALGQLIVSPVSKALVRVFFTSEANKRLGKTDDAREVDRALVLGAGVMGAGISSVLAQAGVRVRLCDVNGDALAAAKVRMQKALAKQVARRSKRAHDVTAAQDRLALGLREWGRLERYDLFLEAVVEDLGVKHQVFAEAVSRGLPADAILATNTSSLSIDAMAETLPHPERLVGIHFFNPPEKMPLVEVVRGTQTSDVAVATACRLATRLGKYPIVVKDSPGFLVNRCLAPYLAQASRLLLEGLSPETIDRVMLDFGMPMGPCHLLDEIGYDVAAKVNQTLAAAFAGRMRATPLFDAMVAAEVLGKKSGGGLYGADGRGAGPGRAVLAAQATPTRAGLTADQIRTRLLYPMVDEAYRCLAEGIVGSADDLDLGLVFGIGFPPFRGGLTGFARDEGLARIVAGLDEMARTVDPGLTASDALRQQATAAG
ncbi:MAG: 3-hydroxyacyl-CoA dehydrogenase NAD-binding domain-containing protein [Planctomycetota bacterium]